MRRARSQAARARRAPRSVPQTASPHAARPASRRARDRCRRARPKSARSPRAGRRSQRVHGDLRLAHSSPSRHGGEPAPDRRWPRRSAPARSRRAPARGSEHPHHLERARAVDLAGVLHRPAERQDLALPPEHRKLVERRLVADDLPAREALARVEVVPGAGGQRISTSPPARTIGATSSASPHRNWVSKSCTCALRGNASGIARITGSPVVVASAMTFCSRGSAGSGRRATSAATPPRRARTPTARARRCRARGCAS